MRATCLFGLLLLIALPVALATGQEQNEQWTFNDFQSKVTSLRLFSNTSPDEKAVLKDLFDDLVQLRSRYVQAYGNDADNASAIRKNLSDAYSRSMLADYNSLQNLPSDQSAALNILRSIQHDLAIKIDFVSHSLAATGVFPSIIAVKVDTVQSNGQRASGLWVRCNPQRYGVSVANPIFVFNSATTPTTATLPPGDLICWVQDSAGKVLMSQPIQLGQGGEASDDIRLAIP